MSSSYFTGALLVLLVAALAYRQYLVLTRDVPPEYLAEQSVVDPIRLDGELAIHRSTKLDLGLRVGLAIRYDKYKLRNGNLYDVWELALAGARHHNTAHKTAITVESRTDRFVQGLDAAENRAKVSLADLNGKAQAIGRVLKAAEVTEVGISLELFMSSPDVLAITVACFINQITVHVYDVNPSEVVVAIEDGQVVVRSTSVLLTVSELSFDSTTDFENSYEPLKDRGVALKVSKVLRHKITGEVSFTQTNLVSAAASCIKSLAPPMALSDKDLMAIILDDSSIEGMVNGVTKMLASFVTSTPAHLCLRQTCMDMDPTVVLGPAEAVCSLYKRPRGLDRVLDWHRQFSLAQLRFSKLCMARPYARLRLIFAHRNINTGNYISWRPLRSALMAHVVEELGIMSAAGPIVTSDPYDFRELPKGAQVNVRGHGTVCQADEIKLVAFDGGQGEICVRGYNIGKTRTLMEGQGTTVMTPDSEGFHNLRVRALWGADGCLYVVQ